MSKAAELLEKLPEFVREHKFVRAKLLQTSEKADPYNNNNPWKGSTVEKANLITSEMPNLAGFHRPLLDLDWDSALLPSSTPGHHHLYINKAMSWDSYKKFLTVCKEVGLLQAGFVDNAIKRGATSLRLPWIDKNNWYDNQADPELELKSIDDQIDSLGKQLAEATAKLNALKKQRENLGGPTAFDKAVEVIETEFKNIKSSDWQITSNPGFTPNVIPMKKSLDNDDDSW